MSRESASSFVSQVERSIEAYVGEAAKNLSPKPKRIIPVVPGSQVAWDDCCSGQLWGRLVSLGPMPGNNPGRLPGLGACGSPEYLATVEIGILRCASVFDDNTGRAPRPAKIGNEGAQLLEDMGDILRALACADAPLKVRSIVGWTPTGPEGGCAGGYWQFTLAVPNCLQCG